jgi:hypothetical protein
VFAFSVEAFVNPTQPTTSMQPNMHLVVCLTPVGPQAELVVLAHCWCSAGGAVPVVRTILVVASYRINAYIVAPEPDHTLNREVACFC